MSEPESTQSSQTNNTKAPQPSAGGLASFAEALAAARMPATDADAATRTEEPTEKTADTAIPPPKKAKPKDLADAAAQLGLKDADLYALLVPSKREGADPYTIGKLKDLAEEHDDFILRGLERDQRDREKHAQYLRATQELEDIIGSLPPEAIKQEVRDKLEARRKTAMAKERQLVLDAIPEWRDADVRTQELEAMAEHLQDAGYPAEYLVGVYDHRTLRYIRDNMLREKAIAAALEKVKERKPTTPPKSARQSPAPGKGPAAPVPGRDQVAHARFGAAIQHASKR